MIVDRPHFAPPQSTVDRELPIDLEHAAHFAGALWGSQPGRTYQHFDRFGRWLLHDLASIAKPAEAMNAAAMVLQDRHAPLTAHEERAFWQSLVPGSMPTISTTGDAAVFLVAIRSAAITAFRAAKPPRRYFQ